MTDRNKFIAGVAQFIGADADKAFVDPMGRTMVVGDQFTAVIFHEVGGRLDMRGSGEVLAAGHLCFFDVRGDEEGLALVLRDLGNPDGQEAV